MTKIVAFDMDGVMCDFEDALYDYVCLNHGESIAIPVEQRTTHNAPAQYIEERGIDISYIAKESGFYANLSPIDGALWAMSFLQEECEDIDVIICSSPLSGQVDCVTDKCRWIKLMLGDEWLDRLIFTRDKTLVRADVLIDDKPVITGRRIPTWRQIVFDAPYNRNVETDSHHRISTWNKDAITDIFHCLVHPLASHCTDLGNHLTDCDSDGYCNHCGFSNFIPTF